MYSFAYLLLNIENKMNHAIANKNFHDLSLRILRIHRCTTVQNRNTQTAKVPKLHRGGVRCFVMNHSVDEKNTVLLVIGAVVAPTLAKLDSTTKLILRKYTHRHSIQHPRKPPYPKFR